MARRLKKLNSLSNVAAGSTATLELGKGLSYHQVFCSIPASRLRR